MTPAAAGLVPAGVTADVLERARRVRLLVLDVDGVLTDGRLHITAQGEETKVFHVRDGSGIVAVQRAGIKVAIISGRDSAAVTRRAAELGIRHVRQGIGDKGAALEAVAATNCSLRPNGSHASATTRPTCRCSSAPRWRSSWPTRMRRSAPPAHWITTAAGGHGAVSEVCDLLLHAQRA